MNIIKIKVDFKNGTNKIIGNQLISGDYASTKLEFEFDAESGTKIFEMKNPNGELVIAKEIENDELLLAGIDENEHYYSLFEMSGMYIYEISLYDNGGKLTSTKGEIPVRQEQVIIGDEVVEPYLPVFDELMQDIEDALDDVSDALTNVNNKMDIVDGKLIEIDSAITQTNNLDIDISKQGKTTTIDITKKDGTHKSEDVLDGKDIEYQWSGTSLGIRQSGESEYQFVNLQGVQGSPGPQGEPFRIKKTYPSVEAMNADFNNMEYGDYVMIASSVEVQDNAKLYTKGELQWIFITDFSGATGIRGETGLTPNIQIGTVVSGETPNVTRTGTNENPILNFVLEKGNTGDTGPAGPTGNGIASIVKTATSGLVDTYTITYTNGNTTTFNVSNGKGITSITKTGSVSNIDTYTILFNDGTTTTYEVANGEVTQASFDELKKETNLILDQIPKGTANGESINVNDSSNLPLKDITLKGNTTQDGTPTPDNPQDIHIVSGDNEIVVCGKNLLEQNRTTTTISGVDFTILNDGSVKCEKQATADAHLDIGRNIGNTFKAGTYIASGCPDNGSSSTFSVSIYKVVNGTATRITTLYGKNTDTPTFTLDEECEVFYRITIASGYTANGIVYKPQIEVGNQQTSYEPYTGNTYNINLGTIELCKIGTYQDKLYYVPSLDKVYKHKEIGKAVLDGSEDWREVNTIRYRLPNFTTIKLEDDTVVAICTSYEGIKYKDRNSSIYSGHSLLFSSSSTIYVQSDKFSSVGDFQTYLSSNNMPLYYVLSTPIEEEITDSTLKAQVKALYEARTKKNVTNISQINNDEAFELDIVYYKDLETLFNSLSS